MKKTACLPTMTTKPCHIQPDAVIYTEPKHKLQDLEEAKEKEEEQAGA